MMTREEFAQRIHWPKLFWLLAFLNPIAFFPQIYSIFATKNVEGISIPMFALFIVIQLTFAFQGYLQRSSQTVWSMGISVCLSSLIIVGTLLYRH